MKVTFSLELPDVAPVATSTSDPWAPVPPEHQWAIDLSMSVTGLVGLESGTHAELAVESVRRLRLVFEKIGELRELVDADKIFAHNFDGDLNVLKQAVACVRRAASK